MNRTILQGDVIEKLQSLPDECIDCVITSPPYWGLRDYGVPGQWGLEPSYHTYLEKMQRFMNEIRRVLKLSGSVWVNLGDTYASSGGPSRHYGYGDPKYGGKNIVKHIEPQSYEQGLEAKSRMAIPERFYIQCIDNGWIARNHIPWYKSNAMPSSVKDRFTNKWESIFFFVKNRDYYFDLDAVREKPKSETKPFNIRVRDNITGKAQKKLGDMAWGAADWEKESYQDERVNRALGNKTIHEKYENQPQPNITRLHRTRPGNPHKQDSTLGADGKPKANYKGFNERWQERKHSEQTIQREHFGEYDKEGNLLNNPKGKNPGDVFFINPKPFNDAHFATFPPELPMKIIKCACPINGVVLDPFFGAGTVGLAAEKLGRKWIGIELNEEYIKIARKRLDPYKNKRLEVFE